MTKSEGMTNDEDGRRGEMAFGPRSGVKIKIKIKIKSGVSGVVLRKSSSFFPWRHELADGTDSTPWVSGFESARGPGALQDASRCSKARSPSRGHGRVVGVHTPDDKVLALCRNTVAGGLSRGLQKAQGDARVERSLIMDDISEFLLGRQQAPSSSYAVAVAVIVGALAIGLMIYLLRCYVQEALFRKRVKRRTCQPAGGNIVPPEAMPCAKALSDTGRLRKKLSVILPALPPDNGRAMARHVRRPRHPWKQNRFLAHSPTSQ